MDDLLLDSEINQPQQEYKELADFGLRLVAWLIDGLIIAAGAWALILILGAGAFLKMGDRLNHVGEDDIGLVLGSMGLLFLGIISFWWLYYALQESSAAQATLGKRAVGIVVTDMDGNRISFGRATGRTFSRILSRMILYIGFIMAAFTDRKQALHDMIAGTLVFKK